MTPKITINPIAAGIKTFQGLRLATGGVTGEACDVTKAGGSGTGIGSIGRVNLRRTKVSSSASWVSGNGAEGSTRLLVPDDETLAGSIPAAIVKSSTNSPTVW